MLLENSESVYNLIPPPPSSTSKKHVYPKSKYKLDGDSFITTIKTKRTRATFGHRPKSFNPCTSEFLKKHSRVKMQRFQIKAIVIRSPKVIIKPPIPHEKPVLQHHERDFISSNAIEMIHSTPKKLPKYVPRFVEKPNYGKVPAYLCKFNEELKKKQTNVDLEGSKQQGLGTQPNTRRLEEWEKRELIEALKKKWQQVNTIYQKTSVTLDTWAKKARKERFEEQLMEIERDIQTLSRRVVLVVDNGKSNSSGSYSSKRRHQASHW